MAIEYADAVSALYRAAHEAFVPERKRLAAELKAAGNKDGAARLAKLVRPPLSAWAVNQLWWNAREAFERLFENSERLRRGDRTAASAHRDVLVALRSRAAQLLADAGHSATDATLRRVATTLSALAAAGSFAPDAPGALGADRDPPGFETLGAPAGESSPAAERSARPSEPELEPERERVAANDTAGDVPRAGASAQGVAQVAADEAAARARAEAERRVAAKAEAEAEAQAQAARERAAKAAERQRLENEAQARAESERRLAEERVRVERERARRDEHARVTDSLRAARQEIELCAREIVRLENELRAAERRSERTRANVAALEAHLARLEPDGTEPREVPAG